MSDFYGGDEALARRQFLYTHFDIRFGQQRLHFLGPFGETVVAAVEIFLVTDVVSLGKTVDSVEIEMIDGLSAGGHILVDDGESGAAHVVGRAEGTAQLFDKGGLSGAHLAVEGEKTVVGEGLQKLPRGFTESVQSGGYLQVVHNYTKRYNPPEGGVSVLFNCKKAKKLHKTH